jgi:hypothetical protein
MRDIVDRTSSFGRSPPNLTALTYVLSRRDPRTIDRSRSRRAI